ncbi:MAG: hypothetical protein LC713_06500, partial [Actinobacteria bacterium]|nr:hypothetical protein [Actinomycetota bacterium]
QQVLAREKLDELLPAFRQLTPDQQLAVAHKASGTTSPAEFCAETGWTLEKYRKVGQRGRARLETLTKTPGLAADPVTVRLPDRLGTYRAVLGEDRARQLAERARQLTPDVASLSDTELAAESARLAPATAQLDRAAAITARATEHDLTNEHRGVDEAQDAAATLREHAGALGGRGARAQRAQLQRTAAAQAAIAAGHQERAGRHRTALEDLRAQGRHPDQWLHTYGDAAARSLAVQSELDQRRARALADQIEQAVRTPPGPVRELIGDPPATTAPERTEWERLCRELERDRLEHERDDEEGLPHRARPREQQDRQRSVAQLRDQLGLPALAEAAREQVTAGLEL